MKMGLPNLEIFAETLLQAALADPSILVVTSDSRGSARLSRFCQTLPRQVVEVGIAEQNLVGIAAGLAASGKKVFAVSPACFLTARALEQIKNDVAYSNHPVRLVGISAGVSYGALGSTHHSLHDLAVLQAIHNIDIVVPADNFETRQAVLSAITHPRPIYLRFGKRPLPDLHPPETGFTVGRAIPLSTGRDVTYIATGEPVGLAVQAAEILNGQGLSAGVISLHSLHPFDAQAVLQAARQTGLIVTVEEHSLRGGLGARCAQVLMEAGAAVRFKMVGIPVEETVSGSQEEIFTHYGLSPAGLANTALETLCAEKNG
jgi:transketolase